MAVYTNQWPANFGMQMYTCAQKEGDPRSPRFHSRGFYRPVAICGPFDARLIKTEFELNDQ